MDLTSLGIASVAAITVICYLVGQLGKASKLDNKWIPIICGIFGAVVGVIAFYLGMPDFPANDVITAAAVGAASGFAATGVNQVGKQLSSKE